VRNPHFFFTARRFFITSGGLLFRVLSRVALRSVRYEVADKDELRRIAGEKQTIFFISNRSSLIEQFLLNVFFIAHGIRVPSHSFGPRTVFFFRFGELLHLLIEWLKGGRPRRYAQKITGLYLPVEDQEFFAHDPGWAEFISKVPSREIRVVPVTTLWNKEVLESKRAGEKEESWLIPFIGTYHLWPTFRELFLFFIGRRRLALRIGLAHTIARERYTPHLYRKFYALLKEEKKNIVGASLRNWFEIRNETLFDLDFGYEADRETAEKCHALQPLLYRRGVAGHRAATLVGLLAHRLPRRGGEVSAAAGRHPQHHARFRAVPSQLFRLPADVPSPLPRADRRAARSGGRQPEFLPARRHSAAARRLFHPAPGAR
jgi:hypothetical protein